MAKVYVRSDWLRRVGVGAYIRADSPVDWKGGLYAVQSQLKIPVHLGGKTVFQLLGQSHFVRRGKEVVHLFSPPKVKLPRWFQKHDWGVQPHHHMSNFLSFENNMGLHAKDVSDFSIILSSLERAILEHLYLIPGEESFDETRHLFEGLVMLNPKRLQRLLESCSSVKVKRLFMALAESFKHPWVKELRPNKIDFGKGNRVLYKNGWLHPKYFITLPENPRA